ncbi:3-hydroxyacyl-CoA dehydrogenase family protein [Deltaproteobacteria bacterium]|nr:3-hydroxyacyl-CoA dehydrogenase family protein [Deltaproteobacteria bacterium]
MTDKNKKIFIVGAGTMGHGIAQCFASAGYEVSLFSRTLETLDRAKTLIKSSLDTFAREEMLGENSIPGILDKIEFTQSFEQGAEDAHLAIETVVENEAVKEEIFTRLDSVCPPGTILASNTTALNIFDFVKTSRPDRVLIAHWYTPPQLIPLVDVVKGPETSDETINAVVDLVRDIDQTPLVLKKFVSGYVVPRLQMATLREIFFLLDNDYVTPHELDMAAKLGLALRMMVVGLVQRIDFGGLDLTHKNMNNPNVQRLLTPPDYKPRKLDELVQEGHLGVKTGKGFYDYAGRSEAELCEERDLKMIKMLKAFKSIEKGE